ncbi:hypothetical protein GCM10025874_21450 [Arenivirga flava]|uniref:Uncharacterized protein n=2 Tax=Arenivirga flava TaxID=1930060 RepID=A0AA37XCV4_9MICO|nr:hypothetical protein GCM10025874_21450 [Arenivirga flava]
MSEQKRRPKAKWKYGPLRLAMPWIAIVVGIVLGLRGLIEYQATGDPLFIAVGFGLAALGVIMFFVYRWMAKRGL